MGADVAQLALCRYPQTGHGRFCHPTDGAESPWGGAQLTFIARKASMPTPPVDPQALLATRSSIRASQLSSPARFYRHGVS
jgi:hypothetical protein